MARPKRIKFWSTQRRSATIYNGDFLTFFVDLFCGRSEKTSTNVDTLRGTLVTIRDVMQLPDAKPWIIGARHIILIKSLRAGHRLRYHSDLFVEKTSRQINCVVHGV